MTGQGGWPMTVRARPRRRAVLRRHLLPGPAAAGAAGVPAGARGALRGLDEPPRRGRPRSAADVAGHLRQDGRRSPARSRSTPTLLAGAVGSLAGDFDATNGGFGSAPKFPPSMVLEFLLRHAARTGVAERLRDGRPDPAARWPAAACYDQLAGGFARYSVDRGWVVPHFEKMLYDNAQLLGVYVRWWRQTRRPARRAGRPADRRLPARRAAHRPRAGSPPRSTPTPRASRAGSTSGRRPSWSRCSAPTTAPGRRRCSRSPRPAPSSTARPRSSCSPSPTTRSAGSRSASRLLAARAHARPPGPRRQGGRRLERSRDRRRSPRPGSLLGEPRYVDAAVDAAPAARRPAPRRPTAAPGLPRRGRRPARRRPGGLRVRRRTGLLALLSATGDVGLAGTARHPARRGARRVRRRGRRLLRHRGGRRAAGVAGRATPRDNASPSGQSALVHALLAYAAVTGSGRHRDAAEAALRNVRTLAERAPAVRRLVAGRRRGAAGRARCEVAVVGTDGDPAATRCAGGAGSRPAPARGGESSVGR